jgi:hypothetical protein
MTDVGFSGFAFQPLRSNQFMSNRILFPGVMVLAGAMAWLCLDRIPLSLQAGTSAPAAGGPGAVPPGGRTSQPAVDPTPGGPSVKKKAETPPVMPPTKNPWRAKAVPTGTTWEAFTYNVDTGKTYQIVKQALVPLNEPTTPIPTSGVFDLQSTSLGTNGSSGYGLLRIDQNTGRCWYYDGNSKIWVEAVDP